MRARSLPAVVATLSTLALQAGAAPAGQTSLLFSSYDVIALKLEAPFNDLFARTRAASPEAPLKRCPPYEAVRRARL